MINKSHLSYVKNVYIFDKLNLLRKSQTTLKNREPNYRDQHGAAETLDPVAGFNKLRDTKSASLVPATYQPD